jgi:hypothetical protein
MLVNQRVSDLEMGQINRFVMDQGQAPFSLPTDIWIDFPFLIEKYINGYSTQVFQRKYCLGREY